MGVGCGVIVSAGSGTVRVSTDLPRATCRARVREGVPPAEVLPHFGKYSSENSSLLGGRLFGSLVFVVLRKSRGSRLRRNVRRRWSLSHGLGKGDVLLGSGMEMGTWNAGGGTTREA